MIRMTDRKIAIITVAAGAMWVCSSLAGKASAREAVSTRPASQVLGAFPDPWSSKVATALDQALTYLESTQRPDGGWQGVHEGSDPAITALVAQCFAQHPKYGPDHPIVRRAVRFVLGFQQDDGGIYDPQSGFGNYTTSVALMMLASLDHPDLARPIREAQRYLKDNQWTEGKTDPDGETIDTGHAFYGGAGYGKHKRPDLSNTQMMVEALHASGLPKDDPAYQKALKFISRCQMLSQTNDMPFARGAKDGGFIYSPANEGESKAGLIEIEHDTFLRSYGSMSYAGFKSMLYADVERNDPRVRAAWDWIRRYYTLESNPNMPDRQSLEGLYYYYHVFAKALEAWGEDRVIDADGREHDWRAELAEQLLKRQHADGSWVNLADRWYEGNPNLVTAYAVLALQAAGELPSDPEARAPTFQ